MVIDKLESAARKAWPALEEVESGYGVLRYAAGVSRRANSLTPSKAGMADPEQLLALGEAFFFPRGLPSIVRVIAAGGWAEQESRLLDHCLASAGYRKVAPAAVLLKSLGDGQCRVSIQPVVASVTEWLQAWYAVKNLSAYDLATHQRMLGSITDSHLLLVARDAAGAARATALGVISDGLLGIYGVATEPGTRRQGLAAALITELFAWATRNGAMSAYLQVEEGNHAAMALYRKLGFRRSYTYWYRCKWPVSSSPTQGLESIGAESPRTAARRQPHDNRYNNNPQQDRRRHLLRQKQEGQQHEHY